MKLKNQESFYYEFEYYEFELEEDFLSKELRFNGYSEYPI